jgi:hypothetical protein
VPNKHRNQARNGVRQGDGGPWLAACRSASAMCCCRRIRVTCRNNEARPDHRPGFSRERLARRLGMKTTWYLHSHVEWLRRSKRSIVSPLVVRLAAHAQSFTDGPFSVPPSHLQPDDRLLRARRRPAAGRHSRPVGQGGPRLDRRALGRQAGARDALAQNRGSSSSCGASRSFRQPTSAPSSSSSTPCSRPAAGLRFPRPRANAKQADAFIVRQSTEKPSR